MEMFGVKAERTITIGNSFGDVSMFELSGLSIAFNPLDMEITGAAADHVVVSQNISDILDVILEIKD
jgi:hydroxymethylpyrimidine pyrophosphatase-like HAD family hydrolase